MSIASGFAAVCGTMFALLCVAPASDAQSYSVSLTGGTQSGTKLTSYSSGTVRAKSTNHTASTSDSAVINTVPSTAYAAGSGPAALGRLSLFATARGFGGLGGSATTEGSFSDTLTVAGAGLPDGAPVKLKVILDLAGLVSASGGSFVGSMYQAMAMFAVQDTLSVNVSLAENICRRNRSGCGAGWISEPKTLSTTIVTAVGATVFLQGSLALQVIANGNTIAVSCPPPNACFVGYGSAAKADFRNKANFYVASLTKGAAYHAASGTSYQPPPALVAVIDGPVGPGDGSD